MNLKIGTKVYLIILSCSLTVGLLLAGESLYQQRRDLQIRVEETRKMLYADYDRAARNHVEIVTSLVQTIYDRGQSGEITPEEAKKQAADYVRALRYEKDIYFWVDTLDGTNVVLYGNKNVEGKNRLNSQDVKGKYLVKELIEAAQKPGGGWVEYWFPKLGGVDAFPKRGYTLLFKPYGWVIGTANFVDDIETIVKNIEGDYTKAFNQSLIKFGAILAGILMLAFFAAHWFSKRLSEQLSKAVSVADSLAAGNLAIQVEVTSKDEAGQLMSAMKNMVANLRDMIAKTVDISAGISSAAHQLHSTSEKIAAGADEISSQITTVASASQDLVETSKGIFNNCTKARDLSNSSTQAAGLGSQIVQETVVGMGIIATHVSETSKTVETLGSRSVQIGNIVGTIEEIADQTNLLALNAAIEAARAGEHGRGFAVVADEVRALAERTTKATREIGGMIKTIQTETKAAVKAMEAGVAEVDKGTASSEKSGHALNDILNSIHEVSEQINLIADSTKRQTTVVDEVTGNIDKITAVIRETTDEANAIAQSSSNLESQAEVLQSLVNRFKL